MNFNNNVQLFVNLRESILAEDPPLRTSLQVIDGHILHKREVIARFTTDADARKLLLEAGFVAASERVFTAKS